MKYALPLLLTLAALVAGPSRATTPAGPFDSLPAETHNDSRSVSSFAQQTTFLTPAEFRRACIVPRGLRRMRAPHCRITAAGIRAQEGYAFQVQEWGDGPWEYAPSGPRTNLIRMIVLLNPQPDGTWRLGHSVGPFEGESGFQDYWPWSISAEGREGEGVLVQMRLPLSRLEEGDDPLRPSNMLLFRRPSLNSPWNAVHTQGWLADLQHLLGADLAIRSVAYADIKRLNVTVNVTRPGDPWPLNPRLANTRRQAHVRLTVMGNRLTIHDFHVTE